MISRIVGANVKDHPDLFQQTVQMYVYEELVEGKKLTEIINTEHENVKYLKGFKLPENIVSSKSERVKCKLMIMSTECCTSQKQICSSISWKYVKSFLFYTIGGCYAFSFCKTPKGRNISGVYIIGSILRLLFQGCIRYIDGFATHEFCKRKTSLQNLYKYFSQLE